MIWQCPSCKRISYDKKLWHGQKAGDRIRSVTIKTCSKCYERRDQNAVSKVLQEV